LSFFENQKANADVGIEVFKFGDVANGHWERESRGVQFVQMEFVMRETIGIMIDGVNSGQHGPQKTKLSERFCTLTIAFFFSISLGVGMNVEPCIGRYGARVI